MEIQWVCVILMEMYSENGHKKPNKKQVLCPNSEKTFLLRPL